MKKLNMRTLIICVCIGIFLSACQTAKYSETAFEQKLERLIAVSPLSSKERLELLRVYGSQEDKSNFLNQDEFVYPQKLESLYLKSKGTVHTQQSHCPRTCRVVICRPPYLDECGVICGADPNCPDPACKPGQAC